MQHSVKIGVLALVAAVGFSAAARAGQWGTPYEVFYSASPFNPSQIASQAQQACQDFAHNWDPKCTQGYVKVDSYVPVSPESNGEWEYASACQCLETTNGL